MRRLIVILLLLVFAALSVEASLVAILANLVFENGVSLAVDEIFNTVFDDGKSKRLDEIIGKLNAIDSKMSDGFANIEELLKKTPTFDKAQEIERKLLTKIDEYRTILDVSRKYGANQTQETINYVNRFKEGLTEVPSLLYQLHLLIVGDSTVDAGLFSGLAKNVIQQILKNMKTVAANAYDVNRTVQEIIEYRDSLMSLQVTSFQLYHSNCPDSSAVCTEKLNDIKLRLTLQYNLFTQSIPKNFDRIRREKNIKSVFFIDPESNAVLFSKQMSSIVQDGIMDWEKIATPQDAGLGCSLKQSREKWTLEDASVHGRNGYFLKLDSGCYLSIDRPFIEYTLIIPLVWATSDAIDRYEFLICLPHLTSDAVTFFLFADAPDVDTTYHLKAHHTGITNDKFLHIRKEKTSVNEEIDRRLELTLFLTDIPKSWSIDSETNTIKCDVVSDSKLVSAAVGGEENGCFMAIGVALAVTLLL